MGKKITLGCIIGFIGVVIVAGIIMAAYIVDSRNKMVAKEIEVENSWAQVQNV